MILGVVRVLVSCAAEPSDSTPKSFSKVSSFSDSILGSDLDLVGVLVGDSNSNSGSTGGAAFIGTFLGGTIATFFIGVLGGSPLNAFWRILTLEGRASFG